MSADRFRSMMNPENLQMMGVLNGNKKKRRKASRGKENVFK